MLKSLLDKAFKRVLDEISTLSAEEPINQAFGLLVTHSARPYKDFGQVQDMR
jgi:hypothetical protein